MIHPTNLPPQTMVKLSANTMTRVVEQGKVTFSRAQFTLHVCYDSRELITRLQGATRPEGGSHKLIITPTDKKFKENAVLELIVRE